MNSSFTGISEVQREIINLFSQGLSDKEISNKLNVATSTIRNHRYKTKRKRKTGKIIFSYYGFISSKY